MVHEETERRIKSYTFMPERGQPKQLDLLPCPFCGAKADQNPIFIVHNEYGKWWIRCGCCAAEGPWAKSRSGACGGWNRRVIDGKLHLNGRVVQLENDR